MTAGAIGLRLGLSPQLLHLSLYQKYMIFIGAENLRFIVVHNLFHSIIKLL